MWHDPTRNLLVYERRDDGILAVQGAKPLINGYVAVPDRLPALQHLAHLGYPTIAPLRDYPWTRSPAIKQPFEAQVATANYLALHPHANCLSDMGTGKTLAALWAADWLMTEELRKTGNKIRTLVLAPLSTLNRVWGQAVFENFLNKRKALILHGTPEKRIKLLAEEADFYILNHDGIKIGASMVRQRELQFKSFSAALQRREDIQIVVVDEVRAFGDYRTARSRVAYKLLSRRSYVWGLTGTPTPNAPTDAYGIAALTTGVKGESFTSFKAKTMYQISMYKWLPRQGAQREVQKLLAPSIRFSIDECADLPELITEEREVELTSSQTDLLKKLKNDFVAYVKHGTVTVANEAALRIKMIQASCGAIYDEKHEAHLINCWPRLAAVRDIVEEAGAKVLVFAPFVSVVNMLHKDLTKHYTCGLITGTTPVKDRIEILKNFQDGKDPRVLVAHPETISHGLTLTAAATIVWYAPVDKTDVYIQACKRIHRPGQSRTCVVVNLSATAVERETYRRLLTNERMQGVLLKLVEEQRL